VSIGFGHLTNQPKSTSATSTGCCLAFSSAGAGLVRFKRSKMFGTAGAPWVAARCLPSW